MPEKDLFRYLIRGGIVFFSIQIALCMGCISLMKGEFLLSGGQYQKGAAMFTAAVEKAPDNPNNWYYLGRFLLAKSNYQKANDCLKKAVELDGLKDRYYFWLGISYGALGKSEPEINSYQTAVNLNPKNEQALTYLGHSYLRKKQYSRSIELYNQALAARTYNPSALYSRGLAYFKTGKAEPAKKDFKRYIKEFNNSPKAIRAVGYLNRMGDFDYRVIQVDKQRLVSASLKFRPKDGVLTTESRDVLDQLAQMIRKKTELRLYVVAYEKNNRTLAKKRALQVESYLEQYHPFLSKGRVVTSFFGVEETHRFGRQIVRQKSSVHLFAVPKDLIP